MSDGHGSENYDRVLAGLRNRHVTSDQRLDLETAELLDCQRKSIVALEYQVAVLKDMVAMCRESMARTVAKASEPSA